jgi:hypothetical protein
MFVSTDPSKYKENSKAYYKNYNLKILSHIYNGNKTGDMRCAITKRPAFVAFPHVVTKTPRLRFNIDFNHIRQQATAKRHAGYSLDKSSYGPSEIFRQCELDSSARAFDLFEFMTIMPVCSEVHSYISQDSAKHDITLQNYVGHWPWFLENQQNYDDVCSTYKIEGIPYQEFVDHLSDIKHPPIRSRLGYDQVTKKYFFK